MIKNKLRRFIHSRYKISFSKSGEDIQIFKLLNSSTRGYLDIGCFEPMTFSNIYFFYLRGWTGVVVDPNPNLHDLFKIHRPQDTFVNKGVSSEPGLLKYYTLPYKMSSMNTFDYGFLERNNLTQYIEEELSIPIITMDELISEFKLENKIDFLDVDVEGLDLEVLKSNNWESFRPKVIMVETDQSIEEDLNSGIYQFLKEKDYRLISKHVQNINGSGNLIFVKDEFKP